MSGRQVYAFTESAKFLPAQKLSQPPMPSMIGTLAPILSTEAVCSFTICKLFSSTMMRFPPNERVISVNETANFTYRNQVAKTRALKQRAEHNLIPAHEHMRACPNNETYDPCRHLSVMDAQIKTNASSSCPRQAFIKNKTDSQQQNSLSSRPCLLHKSVPAPHSTFFQRLNSAPYRTLPTTANKAL